MEEMSSYNNTNDIRESTAQVLSQFESELADSSPRLKAGVMMVANHILRMASRVWGKDVVDDPKNAKNIAVALHALLSSRVEAREIMEWTGKNEPSLRHCMAIDLCISTIGYGLIPLSGNRVSNIWREIWLQKEHLSEALVNIREWETERGVSALPRDDNGDYPDDTDALTCGRKFPLFLQARTRR